MLDPAHCSSTHGGSGYPPQTRVAPDGKLYCPFCGVEMDRTLFDRGYATYIDENMGAPKKEYSRFGRGPLGWLARIGAAIVGEDE